MAFNAEGLIYQIAQEFEEAGRLPSHVEKRLRDASREKDPEDLDDRSLPLRRTRPRPVDEIIGR